MSEAFPISVPIWEKATLTIEEAVLFTGIGRDKLRALTDSDDCDFVIWVGRKRLIKREKLVEFLNNSFSI